MENRWINLQRVTKVTQETKEMQDLNNLLSEREKKIKTYRFWRSRKVNLNCYFFNDAVFLRRTSHKYSYLKDFVCIVEGIKLKVRNFITSQCFFRLKAFYCTS